MAVRAEGRLSGILERAPTVPGSEYRGYMENTVIPYKSRGLFVQRIENTEPEILLNQDGGETLGVSLHFPCSLAALRCSKRLWQL